MSNFHGGISFPPAQGIWEASPITKGELCLTVDQPTVAVGDWVALGQPIGSIAARPQLAPMAGKITAAADGLVKIAFGEAVGENNNQANVLEVVPFGKRTGKTLLEASPEELLAEIRNAGIVEAGGMILADHLQEAMERSAQGKLRQAAVPLLEPDPASLSITSLGAEFAREIAGGLAILLKLLSLREGIILCDKAYPQVTNAIREACAQSRLIAVEAIANRYPQANTKLITRYLSQRELSHKSAPEAAGLFLIDVESCIALHQLFATGIPRLSVRTTLWEDGQASVYDLPLGLPLTALQEANVWKSIPTPTEDGGEKRTLVKSGGTPLFCRGLMDGRPPVEFADRSLTVIAPAPLPPAEGDCIRCGHCAQVCPMFLQPYQFQPQRPWMRFLSGHTKDAVSCIGCGCCSYVCPARLPLRRFVLRAKQEADLSGKV